MLTRVDQTTFGTPRGNCFAACVASILGLDVADVPNFCYLYEDVEWYEKFLEWLKPRGFGALTQQFPGDPDPFFAWAARCAPSIPWIAGGSTERGLHCTVYVGTELWHDPNPHFGRRGLDEVHDATFLLTDFVTPRPNELVPSGPLKCPGGMALCPACGGAKTRVGPNLCWEGWHDMTSEVGHDFVRTAGGHCGACGYGHK